MDCTKLEGRMREICEGRSGLPPEMEEQYRQLWEKGYPIRVGDIVEKIIRSVTFDLLRPKCCGCAKRKRWLNRFVLWHHQPKSQLR